MRYRDAHDGDVPDQPSAQEILDQTEQAFRDIAKEGDATVAIIGDKITPVAAALDVRADLLVPIPDSTPQGDYDPLV